jgi:hypothetical protein
MPRGRNRGVSTPGGGEDECDFPFKKRNKRTDSSDDETDATPKFEEKSKKIIKNYINIEEQVEETFCEDCWGCVYLFGPATRPGENPNHDQLYREFEIHRPLIHLEAVARLVAKYHEDFIYRPEVEAGITTMFWPYDKVLRHFRKHMQHYGLDLQKGLERYELVETRLTASTFDEDAQPDHRSVGALAAMAKLKITFSKELHMFNAGKL